MVSLTASGGREWKVFLIGWNEVQQLRSKNVCDSRFNAEENEKNGRKPLSILL
jgi:hypothetical protein